MQNVHFQYILIKALQIVVAYYSFTKEFFIHCRNVYKYNTLNNKFSHGIHSVTLINQCKFLFTVKDKYLLYSVMIKNATRFGLYGHLQAKYKSFMKKWKDLKICLNLRCFTNLNLWICWAIFHEIKFVFHCILNFSSL